MAFDHTDLLRPDTRLGESFRNKGSLRPRVRGTQGARIAILIDGSPLDDGADPITVGLVRTTQDEDNDAFGANIPIR